MNRRQLLVAAGGTSLIFPLQACAAQLSAQQFTPEAFGAVGDGLTDDYDAFVRLAKAVNAARGGRIAFTPSRHYFLNRYVSAQGQAADVTFEGCDGLTIEGNGATISVKGDFNREQRSTRSLAGLRFIDCRRVSLRNLSLDGNVHRTTRVPQLAEPPSHGLFFQSCFDVAIDGLTVIRFAADGLYITQSKKVGNSGSREASRRFTVRNSRFLFNARQGLSIIQLRGGLFENCEFSHTGYIEPGIKGSYGSHSPSAGVDVEPNSAPFLGESVDVLTGDILFRSCRMVGNGGSSFVAAKFSRGQRYLEQVSISACYLECNSGQGGGGDGFIFDVPGGKVTGCTLQMVDKTAYLGWYAQSDATFEFSGNSVYGRNPSPRHPLLQVRRTHGAPIIERNGIFAAPQPSLGEAAKPWLMKVSNPNAIVRNNQLLLTKAPVAQ